VLQLGPVKQPSKKIEWISWEIDRLELSKVRSLLLTEKPEFLGILNVPNQRTREAVLVQSWLRHEDEGSVDDARRELLNDPVAGVDPQQLWEWTSELPYTVSVSLKNDHMDGAFDVLFHSNSSLAEKVDFPSPVIRSGQEYSNRALTRMDRYMETRLRNFLKDKLPEYMVPGAFVMLDEMPVTSNGKLDRNALPAPVQRNRALEADYVEPRTAEEKFLCQVWAEVLRLDRVGIFDNFLELGGNSLMATQVVSRVRDNLGVELPLTAMFDAPTVARLGPSLQNARIQVQDGRFDRSENAFASDAQTLCNLDNLSDDEIDRMLANMTGHD
jgi:hypothetical protein